MKRITSIILIAAVFMAMLGLSVYAAAPEISVSTNDGSYGEIITASVMIDNNPGIASYKIKLNFDKSKLCPIEIYSDNGDITSNIQQPGADVSALDFVTAVWSSESNTNTNGILFNVKFRITTDINTISNFNISYNKGDICDKDYNDIAPSVKNTSVMLNASAQNNMWLINGYGSSTVQITAPDKVNAGEKLKVYAAAYNSGMLTYFDAADFTVIFGQGKYDVTFKNIIPSNAKIMLWNNNYMPMANAYMK